MATRAGDNWYASGQTPHHCGGGDHAERVRKGVAQLLAFVLVAASALALAPEPALAYPAQLEVPFSEGETWYICQGYYSQGGTHSAMAALDLTPSNVSSCTAGSANDATGRTVRAPAAGTVSARDMAQGGFCLNLDLGGTLWIGHLNSPPANGTHVSTSDVLGTVAGPGVVSNGGYAHIHIQLRASCSSSPGVAFAASQGGSAFRCAGDLPDTNRATTFGQYAGSPLSGCLARNFSDVNGDGRSDLIWYHADWNGPNNGRVFSMLGNASGGFGGLQPVADGLGRPDFASVGPLDGRCTAAFHAYGCWPVRRPAPPPPGPATGSAPGAPTGLTSVAADGVVYVSWRSPTHTGGVPLISYRVALDPGGATVTVSAPATTTTFSSVANGTTFTASVSALNSVGAGPAATSNAVTPEAPPALATVPGAPLAATVSVSSGATVVTWEPPLSDGGSRVVGYAITANPGGLVHYAGAATQSSSFTGLATTSNFTFGVQTITAAGISPMTVTNSVRPVEPPSLASSSSFVPLIPARLLETRAGETTADGLFAGDGLRAAGSITELQATGRGGVPVDAAAVVLNVTVTDARGAGYVTVWPCGSPRPTASNLNFTQGSTIPNAVVAKVGTGGKVCLYTQSPTHLLADVNGYDTP